ncbi:MAG: hypothetical protein OXC95_18660 [Dehalococcoidia bacterium]|nr:hypothetical protein [Dehalococcoidia bacterium]
MWTDPYARERGHPLMTSEIAEKIPPCGAHDDTDVEQLNDMIPYVSFFSTTSDWKWHILEWNPDTGMCNGLVEGTYTEWGPFELTELAGRTARHIGETLPEIRRYRHKKPITFGKIQKAATP